MSESKHIMNQAKNRAGKREKEVKPEYLDDKKYRENFDQIDWSKK